MTDGLDGVLADCAGEEALGGIRRIMSDSAKGTLVLGELALALKRIRERADELRAHRGDPSRLYTLQNALLEAIDEAPKPDVPDEGKLREFLDWVRTQVCAPTKEDDDVD